VNFKAKVNDNFPNLNILAYDTFDAQRPFQPPQCFNPQPVIVTLSRHRRAWRNLTLPPNAQNPRMREVDAPLAVQTVEAFDHIIRLTRPAYTTLVGAIPRTFPPSHQRGHGPKPGLLGAFKRSDLGTMPRPDMIRDRYLMDGKGHGVGFRFSFGASGSE
jgi:hypothetical protein